jgi:hypothetical protein
MARWIQILSLLCFLVPALCAAATGAQEVSFARDVRPILATKCFPCHGPESAGREADLRLDRQLEPHADRGGYQVIQPGRPDASELYRRITASDDERMPPATSGRPLTEREQHTLRDWIAAGGTYEEHWAWTVPRRPALPAVQRADWAENAIDLFVLAQIEVRGWQPSAAADKTTLLRRVTLDLTGLPPAPGEIEAFLQDIRPDAYERLVDRLLSSPRYGERMAQEWLDAARFADSGGYQGDILRTMWPWRDWVIRALNGNMPFDQFTIEQMAGELLPQPGIDQRIATGLHRNHRINDEDGIILEEFRVEYVADRVDTTATVWLGLTMACARCHDHKYDPLTQRDYYALFAFFNNIAEEGRGHGNSPPVLSLFTPAEQQRLDAIQQRLSQLPSEPQNAGAAAEDEIKALTAERDKIQQAAPSTMIMQERSERRPTHILVRGAYDHPGEIVEPEFPSALPSPSHDLPRNRLGLAQWLVDANNPLTARVTVNRLWQTHFGTAIVATPEDFGTQGELPTHPQLLDWLAVELMSSGWDIKAMQRLIVTSATYRQSSQGTPESFAQDPHNRWLARGARFRLSAESIRDQALAASGLLVERIGGPSVRPYQPDGLWKDLASNSLEYDLSPGGDLYRRSLYTFLRRTIPSPQMSVFDAPNREVCTVRRSRTNTPLQALVLMNDPTYVEAARALAQRVLREAGASDAQRVQYAFRLLTARAPDVDEQTRLVQALAAYRARYAAAPQAARALIAVGQSPPGSDSSDQDVELAAMAAVAGALMNLDEVVTRE